MFKNSRRRRKESHLPSGPLQAEGRGSARLAEEVTLVAWPWGAGSSLPCSLLLPAGGCGKLSRQAEASLPAQIAAAI